MSSQTPAPKFLKLVGALVALVLLSACGKGFKAESSSVKSFTNPKTKLDYRILLEKPEFYSRPDQQAAKASSDKTLAAGLHNVRIDMNPEDPTQVMIRIKLVNRLSVDFSASMNAVNASMFTFTAASADARFTVSGLCAESFCDHSSIVLTEKSSRKFVQIDYARSTEYLKAEDLSKINVDAADRALLNDVIEYHLPITRHAAKIAARELGKEVVDLLIVSRPQVDSSDEAWDDAGADSDSDSETTPPVETGKPPVVATPPPAKDDDDERVIELEATSEDEDAVTPAPIATPAPAPSAPSAPGPVATPTATPRPTAVATPAPTRPSSSTESSELKLTSNPYEVYNITIPVERLKGLTVNDPLQTMGFQIIPANQQRTYEPAFRMAVLAEAFVDQKVKIYRSACNIFVRSVMTLAGYTKGGQYNANEFGRLFANSQQGLDKWDKKEYAKVGNSAEQASNHSSLERSLQLLPESYATVAQVIRPGRHGHVAIVVKVDGIVSVIDASLDAHGPRKTTVRAEQLLNARSRKNLNLYGIKGIVR